MQDNLYSHVLTFPCPYREKLRISAEALCVNKFTKTNSVFFPVILLKKQGEKK